MTTTSSREFHMRDRLGKGGFGVVYRAVMLSVGGLRTEVAVKILHNPTADSVVRLRREAKLISSLRHPAILHAYDLIRLRGQVALITEYVAGIDLTEAFREEDPPSHRAVVQAIGAVSEALHVAFVSTPTDATEPMRLVHRDIKPSNIRLGAHGEVKLLDFGIAWAEDGDGGTDAATRGTSVIGSVPYMAPERFWHSHARPEGDTYGLGCTLFEGIAGVRLHDDVTLGSMAVRCSSATVHDGHVDNRLAALSADNVHPQLIGLMKRMLHFDPEHRMSAIEVASECESLADLLSGQRLKTWCREHEIGTNSGDQGPLSGQMLTEGEAGQLTPAQQYDEQGETSAWLMDETIDEKGNVGATASLRMPDPDVPSSLLPNSNHLVAPTTTPSRRPVALGAAGAVVALLMVVAAAAWAGGVFATPSSTGLAVQDPTSAVAESSPPDAATPLPSDDATPAEVATAPATTAPTPIAEPIVETTPQTATTRPSTPRPNRTKVTPPVEPPATAEPAAAEQTAAEVTAPTPVVAKPGRAVRRGDDDVHVELRGDAGDFPLGDLPSGVYRVFADFDGDGLAHSGLVVTVPPGGVVQVECNSVKWSCK